MDAQIGITDGTGEELRDLGQWLGAENQLRGRVRVLNGPIGKTELGSIQEVLSVTLGTGGAGTVLASSLITWLRTRMTTAKIIVKSAGRSITLDIKTASDVAPLLEQILHVSDDD